MSWLALNNQTCMLEGCKQQRVPSTAHTLSLSLVHPCPARLVPIVSSCVEVEAQGPPRQVREQGG